MSELHLSGFHWILLYWCLVSMKYVYFLWLCKCVSCIIFIYKYIVLGTNMSIWPCCGKLGNKSQRQMTHLVGINSTSTQAIFIRYNLSFPIQKLWNSVSITKAYLGWIAIKGIYHECTTILCVPLLVIMHMVSCLLLSPPIVNILSGWMHRLP